MIKTIKVINYLGEQLDLELSDPYKTGLWVESVTGIGGGKATINVTDLASDDGGIFNSARSETRNIVLTLGMLEIDGSIEQARIRTYHYFPRKKWVKLIFVTDIRQLSIEGYVESNEPEIFSDKETTQISIICPDPNFYKANGYDHTSFGGIDNQFEFPFSNEGIPEDDLPLNLDGDVTEFGKIAKSIDYTVDYGGEIDTGVTIYLHFLENATGVEIYNVETGENIKINDSAIALITGSGIIAQDEITICTVNGKKSAVLTRNGLSYNVMNALGRNPSWFQLHQEGNIFTLAATTGYSGIECVFYYSPAYEGV